jgi:phosphoribosylformylglycinamidine synthase
MLLVAEKGREDEVLQVFTKWGLDGVIVGEVIAEPRLKIWRNGVLEADIPNTSLTDDAPKYHRPVGEWKAPVPVDPPAEVLEALKQPRDYTVDLKKLLASSNICSKRWVYEQYDSMVQTNTVDGPGGEAGVMRIKESGTPGHERGLAMALAGNGRWCYLDPKLGAMHAVAEAARKVACTGATPVATTNCLNFGNPEKPQIMAQLSAAIDGMAEACTALGAPVTGGNVSLYNETRGEGIYPTPVIGIVGVLDDVTKAVPSSFQRAGEEILLIGPGIATEIEPIALRSFGSSEFARVVLGKIWGNPPYHLELDGAAQLNQCLAGLVADGLITAAFDVNDGGIAVSLAEASFGNGIGVSAEALPIADAPIEVSLFGEYASQVVITCSSENVEKVRDLVFGYSELSAHRIGKTVTDTFTISVAPGIATNAQGKVISTTVAELRKPWAESLDTVLEAEVFV